MARNNRAVKVAYDPALHEVLRPAAVGSHYWTIHDQATADVIRYNAEHIAPRLQLGLIEHFTEPPRNLNGFSRFLVVLASRQSGKSRTTALCMNNKIAHTPSSYGAILADKKGRVNDLFSAINDCQMYMDPSVAVPTVSTPERNQITYYHNGRIRGMTDNATNEGIGRSVDALQFSEVPFCGQAERTWHSILPALNNRTETVVVMESTPAAMDQASAAFYRDICAEARRAHNDPHGRWTFLFSAFFESRLNERKWDKSWSLTTDEQALLERAGPKKGEPLSAPGNVTYLTLENLAFRREVLTTDPLIRLAPELFEVFFPVDVLSCWQQPGGSSVPAHALDAVRARSPLLVPWNPINGLQIYHEATPGATYILAADPAGWGSGKSDHASIQVFELWHGEIRQVAVFSSNRQNPHFVANLIVDLAARYNNAYTIVENTGVGAGTITLLEQRFLAGDLKHLHYEQLADMSAKPGVPAQARTDEAMAAMVTLMLDALVLHDEQTLEQLATYRQDKKVEDSARRKILMPNQPSARRRDKHHWDRVSALSWACYAIIKNYVRLRHRPDSTRVVSLLPRDVRDIQELPPEEQALIMKEATRAQTEMLRKLAGDIKKSKRAERSKRRKDAMAHIGLSSNKKRGKAWI